MNPKLIQDLLTVVPLIALIFFGMIPVFLKVFAGNKEPDPFASLIYGFIGLLFATGLTVLLTGAKKTAFNGAIVVDGITIWTSYLVYLVTSIALMLAYDHVNTRGKQFSEYIFLTLSSTVGMVILIMSNDLIVSFIGIETMSLSLYILVAMSREPILSKEASFKYFVLGSFASAIFLYGAALVYGAVGSTYYPEIVAHAGSLLTTNRVFLIGFLLVTLGFGFKVSMFPMHSWTPDVYQGASTPVTAFMATAVKAATFIAFIRLMTAPGLADSTKVFTVMQWLAVGTMFVGNVSAILQDNLKRMLAYSSVAHSGYLLVGLIACGFGNNPKASTASILFYLFSYALMTLGSFALVALYERKETTVATVSSLKGLASKHPTTALSLTVLLLSLAGIPPTLGFFGKFYLFSVAIEQDLYWLAFWGVVNSVISVYYYLRPVVMMYMTNDEPQEILTANYLTRMTLVMTAVLVVLMGLMSSNLIQVVQKSVN